MDSLSISTVRGDAHKGTQPLDFHSDRVQGRATAQPRAASHKSPGLSSRTRPLSKHMVFYMLRAHFIMRDRVNYYAWDS